MSAAVTSPSLSPGATRLVGETGAYEQDRCPTGRRALPARLGVPAAPGPRQPSPVLPSRRLAGVLRGSCPATRTSGHC